MDVTVLKSFYRIMTYVGNVFWCLNLIINTIVQKHFPRLKKATLAYHNDYLILGYPTLVVILNEMQLPLRDHLFTDSLSLHQMLVSLELSQQLKYKFNFYIIRAAMPENRSSGFPTRSDTNRPVQSQKQARTLKFWILEEEGLYYP